MRSNDVGAVGRAILDLDFVQERTDPVVPTEFARELVPDAPLHGGRTHPPLETPLHDFLVGAALSDPLTKCLEADAEETAQMAVEPDAQTIIRVVFLGKLPGLMQPDFVQQPGKVI